MLIRTVIISRSQRTMAEFNSLKKSPISRKILGLREARNIFFAHWPVVIVGCSALLPQSARTKVRRSPNN